MGDKCIQEIEVLGNNSNDRPSWRPEPLVVVEWIGGQCSGRPMQVDTTSKYWIRQVRAWPESDTDLEQMGI